MSDTHIAEDINNTPNPAEAEARRTGWVPKEEFKGDPDRWRPADEWNDRGATLMPLLRKDNERLQKRVGRLEERISQMVESTKEMVEFHTKGEQRAYERAMRDLEAKAQAAAANADTAGVNAAMQEMRGLQKPPEPKKVEQNTEAAQIDPELQEWIDKNRWFNVDRALNGFAIETFGQLQRDKPGMSNSELLAETTRLTREKFPEKFGINPNRENAASVAEPRGGTPPRKGGKTYADLPPEAKHACDKFVKTIPGYTREKYIADYDWDA